MAQKKRKRDSSESLFRVLSSDSLTGDGVDMVADLDDELTILQEFVIGHWSLVVGLDTGGSAVGLEGGIGDTRPGGIDGDAGETDTLVGIVVR